MFFTLFMFIVIVAYMFDGTIGMLLMACATIYVMNQKMSMIYKLLYLCVTSLPLCYIGIKGMEMYQIVTWTNIFLMIMIFLLLYMHHGFTKGRAEIAYLIFLLLIVLCLNNIVRAETSKPVIEIIQIFIMVIPVAIIHGHRNDIRISENEIIRLMLHYSDICVVTAFATIFQWMMYFRFGKEIGFVTVTARGARVICNCLFKGMSMLSIFMGAGFIILMLSLESSKNKALTVLKMAMIIVGIIVNTSRSGFVGIVLVLVLYYGVSFFKKAKISILFLGTIGISFLAYAASKLSSIRGNLFDENGRFMTWRAGITIWTDNVGNFLFGAGFEDSIWRNFGSMVSHNMLIQSLAQCGVIGTLLFISLFVIYFRKNVKSKYLLLVIYLIVTGMMVTDFYANPFITIALCLVDIAGATTSLGINRQT